MNAKYLTFNIGDKVKLVGSAIVGQGIVKSISEGGDKLFFPWKDSTPHYGFEDEKTGVFIVAHPRDLKKYDS